MRIIRLLSALLLLAGAMALWAAPLPSNAVNVGVATRVISAQELLAQRRAQVRQQHRLLARYKEQLVRMHAVSPKVVMPRFDTFVVDSTAAPVVTRSATRANALTFAYNGWTTDEELALSTFLAQAYPVLVNLYGAPIGNGTLTLVKGGLQEGIEGGELNLTDPANMTLTVEPLPEDFTTTDSTQYGFNLLHLVLHAFRAPALIGFDAWEEGQARAAAAVAMLQLRANFQLIFAFSYLLPIYDGLNQPALATSKFYPAQAMPLLPLWRTGMAMSAWLKVYGQQLNVFRDFNTAYAAQIAGGDTGLPGNLAALKSLVAASVPTIEGLSFSDWYARQYVLQPTPQVGQRLFVYPVPLNDNISLQIYYFTAAADGSETPLAGTANLEYFSFDQLPLYPEEGDTVAITTAGDFPGVGFINPSFFNIGDPPNQRIRIGISVNDQRAVVYFPYFSRGEDADENEFWGATIGADDGTLQILVPGIALSAATVVQGSFSKQLSTGDITFFAPVKFVYTSADQQTTVTLWRNVGPGFYAALLVVGDETEVNFTHTFLSGMSMVSFPLTPDDANPATIFGVPAGLQFARWDPSLPGTDKYRRYPDANLPAIRPGMAYWVKLSAHRTVTLHGQQLSYDDPRSVVLQPGWNMVGNTYNAPLNPWAMTIETDTAAYTLAEALAQGIVGPVWTYNGTTRSYGVKNELAAWEGGWLVNLTVGPIIVRQFGATRGITRTPGDRALDTLAAGGWIVALQAAAGDSHDTAYLGVSNKAKAGIDGLDWMKPPAIEPSVRLSLVNPAQRLAGAIYASDIRAQVGSGGETWEFESSSAITGPVTLSWPDLRRVPEQYQLILEDLATGSRYYMRTKPSFTYQSAGTATTPEVRRFRLLIEARSRQPLNFVNLTALPTRGSGLNVRFALTAPASVSMEIRTATGKLIRTVRLPVTRASEPAILAWDGKTMNGKLMPTGAYVLTLTAQSEDGYVIRRTLPAVTRQ